MGRGARQMQQADVVTDDWLDDEWVPPAFLDDLDENLTATPQGTGSTWVCLRVAGVAREHPSTGKFLFFDADPRRLVTLASSEMLAGRFASAKVTVRRNDRGTHCLCLFAVTDEGGAQLAARWPDYAYRGWKSHEQTRADAQARRQARRAADGGDR